jgi:hypothetical protein
VRVLIQRAEDGLFLDNISNWGPRAEAYDFPTVAAALGLCFERRLQNVRIFFDSGDTKQDWFVAIAGPEAEGLPAMTASQELEKHMLKALAKHRKRLGSTGTKDRRGKGHGGGAAKDRVGKKSVNSCVDKKSCGGLRLK